MPSVNKDHSITAAGLIGIASGVGGLGVLFGYAKVPEMTNSSKSLPAGYYTPWETCGRAEKDYAAASTKENLKKLRNLYKQHPEHFRKYLSKKTTHLGLSLLAVSAFFLNLTYKAKSATETQQANDKATN